MPSDGSSSNTTDRVRCQSARDREHLLFAAAHCACRTLQHVGKVREQLEQIALGQPAIQWSACDPQIFFDRQIGKDAAIFGHIAETAALRGGTAAAALTSAPSSNTPPDAARHQSNRGPQQRCFAGTVAANQRDDFTAATLRLAR